MNVTDRLPVLGDEVVDLDPFLERAAKWATDLRYRDIPKPVRQSAKAQLTSTVAAAVWTATHPLGGPVTEVIETRFDGEGATVLSGDDRSPAGAACGNAALSMALDFDDTVFGANTGHSSVFVAQAYAEATGCDGKRALLAHVAANEVAARLAAAVAIGSECGRQTVTVHSVGAAVARAVVDGDEAATLADALGTALLQPPRPLDPPTFGAEAKVWSASEPIRSGLAAVDSARAGLSGRPDLVEADRGFLATFADYPVEELLGGFGDRWHTRAIAVKSVPGRAYVSAPVEAALEVRGRFDRGHTEISRVDVHVSLLATEMDNRASSYLDGPDSPVAALTATVPFNVAAALVDGEHTPRQIGARANNDGIWTLADRVFLHHDRRFTTEALRSDVPLDVTHGRLGIPVVGDVATIPGIGTTLRQLPTLLRITRKRSLPTDLSTVDERIGARVEVTTADDRTHQSTVTHPSGFAGKPLAEIRAVARNKCRTGLQAAGVREAEARARVDELLAIEDAEQVSLAPLVEGVDRM